MFRKRRSKILVQYHAASIGELRREGEQFVFSYLPAFFDTELKPIPDFPDPRKTYHNTHLWPFFANRIPDLRREDVQEFLRERRLKETDKFDLLLALGRETINNPFQLVPAR
jgi:HipA-like protein